MTIKTITQPPFVVDNESERSTSWPNESFVFCKDTGKIYQLLSGVFVVMNDKVTNIASGTLTRAAATASGTEVVTTGFNPAWITFSGVDDGDSTVNCDGWDDGTVSTCQFSSTKNFLTTLLGALGLASTTSKDQAKCINVVNNAGNGHSALITAKSSTGFTLTWTKVGTGRAITIKYLAVK